MRVSELETDEATISATWRGHDVHVTYRPSKYTSNWIRDEVIRPLVEIFPDLILSWDVTEQDGSPVPLEADRLRTMPFGFLRCIYDAVTEDARLGDLPEVPGSSDAT